MRMMWALALLVAWTPTAIPVEGAPGRIVTADLDRDGRPDLVGAVDRSIVTLLNDGRGGFRVASRTPMPRTPSELTAADFNRDEHPDLAAADHDTFGVIVLLGDGKGGMTPQPAVRAKQSGRPHIHGLLSGDWNRDDKPEWILTSVEEGQLIPSTGPIVQIGSVHNPVTADVTGDGVPDVLAAEIHHQRIAVLLADGKGGFAAPLRLPTRARPYFVAAGRLDADPHLDLAVSHDDIDEILLFRGDGRGGFTHAGEAKFPSRAYELAILDVDGDGRSEVVGAAGHTIHVLTQAPNGTLTPAEPIATGLMGAWTVTAADFDGDGQPEFAVPLARANEIRIFKRSPRGATLRR
jgi:hypothetical protein